MAEEIRKKRRIDSNDVSVEKHTGKILVEDILENNVDVGEGDIEQGEMLDRIPFNDDTMSELLDSSSETSSLQQFNFKVKFIDNPYISPVIVQSSSGYVTINGNEESCGSSFADSEMSVMASVDRCSLSLTVSECCKGKYSGACSSDGLKGRGLREFFEDLDQYLIREIDGWDMLLSDDDVLGAEYSTGDLLSKSS